MTEDTLSIVSDEQDADCVALNGPCLVLLFECGRPLAGSSCHELRDLAEVTIGRAPARQHTRAHRADGASVLTLGVPDPRMSQLHARLVLELDRWILEDTGSKNGVILNGTRHRRAVLSNGDLFDLGHSIFLFRDPVAHDDRRLDRDSAQLRASPPGLATFLPCLGRVFEDLTEIAPMPAPVLLHGETGTGKEVIARAVHALSGRQGPFVAVNCGALPATLVESELFGYRKGAFSGATEDRDGLIRSADRGTLFLDEIGDLSLPSQAALLRVLQEREVTPIGATRPVPVQIKLVAATHHDLEAMVATDRFRRDLYARLAGFVVRLPPLRARREDLGVLIAAILARTTATPPAFSIEAGRALMRHDWPLNIRELDSALGVAITLSRGSAIALSNLPEPVRRAQPPSRFVSALGSGPEHVVAPRPETSPTPVAAPPPRESDADRKAGLESLLREHAGNISAVARGLGVSRIQIHRWLRRYELDPDRYR